MPGQLRSDAPWPLILELAAQLSHGRMQPGEAPAGGAAK
jgi:hypothetical protein